MKSERRKEKKWIKPLVRTLKINKSTFSGAVIGAENIGKSGPPNPPGGGS